MAASSANVSCSTVGLGTGSHPANGVLERSHSQRLPFHLRYWRSGVRRSWGLTGAHILLIDDDLNLTRLVRTILTSVGFEVTVAPTGAQALAAIEAQAFDLVILDLRMPVIDGRTLYRELKQRGLDAPVLIASAYGARNAQVELGADGFIEKPFDPDHLIETVNLLLDRNSLP